MLPVWNELSVLHEEESVTCEKRLNRWNELSVLHEEESVTCEKRLNQWNERFRLPEHAFQYQDAGDSCNQEKELQNFVPPNVGL